MADIDNEHKHEHKGEEEQSNWKKRLLNIIMPEGEGEEVEDVNIREALKSIDGRWFLSKIPLLAIIFIGVLGVITNRYQSQQEMIEREALEKEVEDIKYRALTQSSELTQKTRQSKIEEKLKEFGDSTLKPAADAAFYIPVNEGKE